MYSLFLLLWWYLGKNWDFSVTDVGVSSFSATSLFDFWKILGLILYIFLARNRTYLNLSLRLGKTPKHSAPRPVYEWLLAPSPTCGWIPMPYPDICRCKPLIAHIWWTSAPYPALSCSFSFSFEPNMLYLGDGAFRCSWLMEGMSQWTRKAPSAVDSLVRRWEERSVWWRVCRQDGVGVCRLHLSFHCQH